MRWILMIYNRFARWSAAGIFIKILEGLAGSFEAGEQAMIYATYLNIHRTAVSLKKGDHQPGQLAERREG